MPRVCSTIVLFLFTSCHRNKLTQTYESNSLAVYFILHLMLLLFQVIKANLRLLGPIKGDYISEGIVQVKHEGTWGYICPTNWIAMNSYVMCGQLGFPNAEELETYSETIQDKEPVYWLDQVTCKGWESSVVSCDHAGWTRHQCEGGKAVRIKCTRKEKTQMVSGEYVLR